MDDLLLILFRTTLVLTLCGGVCFLALRRIESRVPKLSRLLWVAVLLTGWFWLQPVIQIPIGETADLRPQTVADFAVPAFVEPPTMVGSRPPGGYVGDSRQEPETAIYDVVVAPSAEYRTLSPGGRQPTIIETDNPIPAQERAGVSPPVAPPRGSSATNRQVYAQPLLLAIWFGGMGIVILLSTTAYLRILLSLRKATCADETLSASWWQLLTKHGISPKAVPMVITQHLGPALVRTPLGYRLAVPGELWSELSESGRQGILKHEFAHFRRRDVWKSFFVRMLALPHWFNPVAHYAANRFDELAEQLCDRDAFCSETLKGRQEELSEFARILLLLHDNAPTRFVARQSIFGRNSGNNLQSRIASLNAHPLTERTSVMKKTVLVLGTAAILFAALFRVEFVAQEPPRESATETEEVVAVADATAVLDLTVHRPSGSIALGQDATYTIEITNTG
ncbi:MAG: hypothetical protein FWE95_10625, partial [Planctomycetaceae bacterium]|nr:hypothetical protein [Planctomycetaceae bacterium]